MLAFNIVFFNFQAAACQQRWMTALSERVFFSINVPRLDAFIRARAAFLVDSSEVFHADSVVFLMVLSVFVLVHSIIFSS